MKARQLIESAPHSPETFAILSQALETAWSEVEPRFISPEAREAARLRLSGIILMLARDNICDAERLQSAGVRVFSRDLY